MDVESLLQPISESDPSGPNLEYDERFTKIDNAVEHPANPEKGPDWDTVREDAIALLGETRDLRLALHVARAGLHLEGFPGFRDGLTLIAGLFSRLWDSVHPQLDEDGDAIGRLNIVLSLCLGPELHKMRKVPIVRAPVAGAFGARDILLAEGKVQPAEGETAPDASIINAVFLECPLEELQATVAGVAGSLEAVDAIDKALTNALGSTGSPDVDPLRKLLREVAGILEPRLALRTDTGGGVEQATGEPAAAQAAPPGTISSRQDVVRALGQMCDYFDRHEPSSPIPLLLRRAQRLVDKSFLDILKDMVPDGIKQAEVFRGED